MYLGFPGNVTKYLCPHWQSKTRFIVEKTPTLSEEVFELQQKRLSFSTASPSGNMLQESVIALAKRFVMSAA